MEGKKIQKNVMHILNLFRGQINNHLFIIGFVEIRLCVCVFACSGLQLVGVQMSLIKLRSVLDSCNLGERQKNDQTKGTYAY